MGGYQVVAWRLGDEKDEAVLVWSLSKMGKAHQRSYVTFIGFTELRRLSHERSLIGRASMCSFVRRLSKRG